MQTFEEFLAQKRIDSEALRTARPEEWTRLANMFAQMSPKSFDQQKKFYFNPFRMDFPLKVEVLEKKETTLSPIIPKKVPLKPTSVSTENTNNPEKATTPPPSLKKPLMKPVMKPKEEVAETQVESPEAPQPEVKKLPLKMKPVMKPKEEVAETQGESPEAPHPEVKKLPLKMKPVMKPKVEVAETQGESTEVQQPEVKKLPLKMKPVMKPKVEVAETQGENTEAPQPEK